MRDAWRGGLTLWVCLTLAMLPALALEGRVVLPDGTPVADATITIPGRQGITRTGADGAFTWRPDPRPPFRVLVELPGGRYAAPVLITSIPADGPLIVTVRPLATEAVKVTADAAPHIETPPAAAVGLLTHEDLEQRAPARLVDALENIPGVARSSGFHVSVPSIRGLARGRTLILLDGGRVTTERRAGASAGFLDPFFLEAIEVSRGPGSVAYGSDALGGILHARTRQAQPGAPLSVRAVASAGLGVPEAGGGVEVSRGFAEGGVIFQARGRRFNAYESPMGEIPDSASEEFGYMARFDRETGPGKLTLSWRTDAMRDTQRPTSDYPDQRSAQPREDSHRLSFAYRMDPTGPGTLYGVEGFAGAYRLVSEQDLFNELTLQRDLFLSDVRARDAALRATISRPVGRSRVEGGLDLNSRYGLESLGTSPLGEERAVEDARRFDAGVYASGEVPLRGRLHVSGGLRYDRVTTRNEGGLAGDRSTEEGALSGYASLTAGPFAGLTVTGQAARGFRDPTLSDRYFTGVSGRGFVTGDPDLEPETTLQYDLAARYNGERVRAGLYAYDYRIDDLIERFQTGTAPNGLRAFFFRNRGEARIKGLELELQADLSEGISLELSAQTARGQADDGSDLDDIPGESLTLQTRRTLGSRGYLQSRAAWYRADRDDGPSEQEVSSYAILDLGGGWRPGERLELRFHARNLFDREHLAGPDERAVTAPGRSALLTLVARLGG